MALDAYKAIISKRDTRHYLDRPLPEELIQRILQAGRMAGSSKNSQPVRFVVVRSPERKEALSRCGQYARHLAAAPLVVALVLTPGGGAFDAGRAAQNMMVAAWAEGVTSCPVAMHDEQCARAVLGVPPDHTVATVLAFGYPDHRYPLHGGRQRLPLHELVRWERW